MNQPPRPTTPLFTQMDATLGPISGPAPQPLSATPMQALHLQTTLLRDMLTAMDRQNELLEELVGTVTQQQKQRVHELKQWKRANPRLAKDCKSAAEMLAKVQTEYLQELTDEVSSHADEMQAGDFLFNEFVDRFGPRLAHLNGMLQVLAQLGNGPEPTGPEQPGLGQA